MISLHLDNELDDCELIADPLEECGSVNIEANQKGKLIGEIYISAKSAHNLYEALRKIFAAGESDED